MSDYVIMANSTCDMTAEMAEEFGVEILPLGFTIEDKLYHNYLDGRELSQEEFYNKLRAGKTANTHAVNIGEFIEAIEPHLIEGKDVLVIAFSSGLSTTYNAAVMAARELSSAYPSRKIVTIDSLCASMGEGLLLYYASKLRAEGKSIDDNAAWVEENKLKLCHWFTVDDLNHLKRGGRVSAATALVGTMLGIKPILKVDNEGRLLSVSKARGRQPSLLALLEQMEKTAVNPAEQAVFISHSDCLEDAQWLAAKIKERLDVAKIYISYIGPVIGAHTGPGTVALFFMGTER